MQSKTSFFNKTLFRKNLTRFWPLWAAPSFIGALFPLACMTDMLRHHNSSFNALELTAGYYEIVSYAVPIISLCYAVLVALAVWSYLFNTRNVGLMHTLPIRREGLFLTNLLSGMAMMLIPYVITGGLSILVFACFGIFNPAGILVTILCIIGESLFYFGSATLVAFITGNLFAMPVLYFILHFLAALMDLLVNAFATGFLFGVQGDYSGVVEFLSPTVYLMTHVRCNRTYKEVLEPFGGDGYYHTELVEVTFRDAWVIAVYALVGVILLTLAYALYRKRRSESAGDVMSVNWMKPVFRYGVAICGSMAGGLVLYAIFWSNFQNGDYYDVVPLVFFMLIAGAIFYYAASMLLAKSLRVFRKSWKGLGATALCILAICGALHFDIFGVEKRIPAAKQLDYMTVYVGSNNYELYPDEDAELIEAIRTVHLAIAEDAEYVCAMRENWRYDGTSMREADNVSLSNTVRFQYYLKDGTRVIRRYYVPMVRTRMQTPGTYDYLLDTLVNSDAMKAERFHLDGKYVPDSGYIYFEAPNTDSISFGNREAGVIMAAVEQDISSGACGNYDWFDQSRGGDYAMDLSVDFLMETKTDNGETHNRYDSINIRVNPAMTHTVNALLALDLAVPEALVTRAELYPEKYLADMEYAKQMAELYGAYDMTSFPTPTEIIVDSSSASIGIIGGADGPTQIMVADIDMNPNSSSIS